MTIQIPEHKRIKVGDPNLCPQFPPHECNLCSEENNGCPALIIECDSDCPGCAAEAILKQVIEMVKTTQARLILEHNGCLSGAVLLEKRIYDELLTKLEAIK